MRSMKEIALKVLAVLILFGFFAGWITVAGALNELLGLRNAQSWTSRRAVITHSYATQNRGFQNRKYWDVEIAGVYAGSGEKFGVGRVGFGFEQSVFTRERAERIEAKYPVGTELEVYQDPDHPRQAILMRDNSPLPTIGALAAGLAFGLLPLALYGWGRRRSRH